MTHTAALSAHLWDLRAQAEAKLRCLTRLQQMVNVYDQTSSPLERTLQHGQIVKDVTDLVTISKALRATADDAFSAAKNLPE